MLRVWHRCSLSLAAHLPWRSSKRPGSPYPRRPFLCFVARMQETDETPIMEVRCQNPGSTKLVARAVEALGVKVIGSGTVSSLERPNYFDAEAFLGKLQTQSLGRQLLLAHSVGSTQTFLEKFHDKLPLGTVLVAETQTGGRGRGGNKWQNPPGCLLFSFTSRFVEARTLPFVQYLATMAVVQAAKQLTTEDLEANIKWPNDLYGNNKKLGGVLCNSFWVMETRSFTAVTGIGINVSNREPTTCIHELQERASGEGVFNYISKEELLAQVLLWYERFEDKFLSSGFTELQGLYLKSWLHTNQKVTLEEEGPDGSCEITLVIKGLTSSGFLLAEDEGGGSYELHPDGNSLDFFKGLVRKKLYK
eukprot:scaffold781_cov394-Prasinococcus_capsulatus_cf.AAC.15